MPETKWLYIADMKDIPGKPYIDRPNIIVPYCNGSDVIEVIKLNLSCQGLYPKYVDVTEDVFSYDTLFRNLWNEGKTFIIVEHDIMPWPGAIEQLWNCECIWGAFSYYIFGNLRVQLGCTKFNPQELGEVPLPNEKVHWTRLDWVVISNLARRFESGHLHNPPVAHLNYAHRRTGVIDYNPEYVKSAFGQ